MCFAFRRGSWALFRDTGWMLDHEWWLVLQAVVISVLLETPEMSEMTRFKKDNPRPAAGQKCLNMSSVSKVAAYRWPWFLHLQRAVVCSPSFSPPVWEGRASGRRNLNHRPACSAWRIAVLSAPVSALLRVVRGEGRGGVPGREDSPIPQAGHCYVCRVQMGQQPEFCLRPQRKRASSMCLPNGEHR